jgi:hypothetical protein
MFKKKHPARMTAFTKKNIKHLLDDLRLYSGNIAKITDVYGPHPHSNGHISGVIHTWMDTFNFMAIPMLCDEDSWTIDLADPSESLRRGHRSITSFTFPKIHKHPDLRKRYQIANLIYKAYNGYSNVSEASRLSEYERMLGYDRLSSYGRVLDAIIRDFRSFQQKKQEKQRLEYAKN